MSLVSSAERFAKERHHDQRYGDDLPYEFHLAHAVHVASRFGITDPKMVAAVWLHDVVEDTPTTIAEVESCFGAPVARLVDAVTDQPGKNRRERHAATYPRVRAQSGAVGVKLCDRIANVTYSLDYGSPQLGMYVKEHAAFGEALYIAGHYESMWRHLDRLIRAARPPIR